MEHFIRNGVWHISDTFEAMAKLADDSIDMILCDLPYGTTACKWDAVLPFDRLWSEYRRLAKPNAAIVLTSSQPFTSALVMSNPKQFRHEWIWKKTRGSNPAQVNFAPLKKHESVLVFSKEKAFYNPQKYKGPMATKSGRGRSNRADGIDGGGFNIFAKEKKVNDEYFPGSVIEVASPAQGKTWHPTQKPVDLFEYLIRTYSKEGDIILDNTAGSGTTAVAAENTGRKWICIEQDQTYSEKAIKRIKLYHFPNLFS